MTRIETLQLIILRSAQRDRLAKQLAEESQRIANRVEEMRRIHARLLEEAEVDKALLDEV